jgi:hypothetical protein
MTQVSVSTTTNIITVTQNPTSVSVSNNNNPVNIAQSTADLVEVRTDIGPRGPLGPEGPAASTGSLVSTASISGNVITFTKGNESTFDITISSSSFASNANSASYALTSSFASNANSASYALTSSFATDAATANTATTATNANNVYVNFNAQDTISRIPTFTGVADSNYQLKSPLSGIVYYQRVGNPVTGETGTHSDYLFIGGGSNTAGGIYLNSTVTRYNFIYSDYNTFYIRAGGGSTGDLRLEAHNDIYVSASKVFIESNLENSITASNDISASGDIFGTTGSFEGGLILTAPNGNRFRVNVSNTGVINTNGPI